MPFAITVYNVVMSLHVMVVVAAFGLPLAYPLLLPYVRSVHPRAMGVVHDVQYRLNQRVTAPGTLLILIFGAYLASKRHLWGEAWVLVPLVILVIVGGLGGGFIVPTTRALGQLARAAIERTPPGQEEVDFGEQYETLYRRYYAAEVTLGVLVLVAVFFMTAKPFP